MLATFAGGFETLRNSEVGNTEAGISSVYNAMHEEERLVPTNYMRACNAVVTELFCDSSEDLYAKYGGKIEFTQSLGLAKGSSYFFDRPSGQGRPTLSRMYK